MTHPHVTRASALQAIDHLASSNAGGRQEEAVEMLVSAPLAAAPDEAPTHSQICNLLQIGNPTDQECRLIRLGFKAGIGAEMAHRWVQANDILPSCSSDQLYIGVNQNGFAGVFNAVEEVCGSLHCLYETAEESIAVMEGLMLWRELEVPAIDACQSVNGGAATATHIRDEDHVLVPRGLIRAACSAIDKKRDGTKTLAELRRYTSGDLSQAAPSTYQPATPAGKIGDARLAAEKPSCCRQVPCAHPGRGPCDMPAVQMQAVGDLPQLLIEAARRDALTWQDRKAIGRAIAALQAAAVQGVQLACTREGRIYVAGPMTDLPELNFPAFHAAAADLRARGLTVVNPAEHGIVDGAKWADYLHYDLARLSTCSSMYLLPGWSKSRGAALEAMCAHTLGMRFEHAAGAEHVALISAQQVIQTLIARPTLAQPEAKPEPQALALEAGNPTASQAVRDVLIERQRQIMIEGWTPEHDDQHAGGEMAAAAGCYALFSDAYPRPGQCPGEWPWNESWWKPTSFRRDMVKAGALIVAEIERFDRALARAQVLPLQGDEDEEQLTDWQDGNHKPAAEGVYLRDFEEGQATSEFSEGEWLRDGFFASDIQDAPWRGRRANPATNAKASPTAGMNMAQRILHVGGRNNAAGYVEFGSIQAVQALVQQVLRDLQDCTAVVVDLPGAADAQKGGA